MKPLCLMLMFCLPGLLRAGIPEPGLTLYGVVRQDLGGAHARLTTGTIQVTFTPQVGTPLTLSTTLTNLNSQFSFVLDVPFESSVPGFPVSTNALELTVVASSFTRSPVSVNGVGATILAPATPNLSFGQADRGTFDRMDVSVTLPLTDSDGDGLPDSWENEFFGNAVIANPNADSDQPQPDGFTNLEEFLAGTDPNNPDSVLWVNLDALPGGGMRVEWRGAPDRFYTLLRSTQIDTGFQPIATGIYYQAPFNVYEDLTATGEMNYFYRVLVE